MYNDADIAMAEANSLANDMAAAGRASTHEPTTADLRKVAKAAYSACYYGDPIMESVTVVCGDLGIDPGHSTVQTVAFEAAQDAKPAHAQEPHAYRPRV